MLRVDWNSPGCTAKLIVLASNDSRDAQRVAKLSRVTTHSYEPLTMCAVVKFDREGVDDRDPDSMWG